MTTERRYEYLYGRELQQRIAERPIAWVPLGPLERHGEHLPWGLDGLKAHAQCLRLAERFGGVVLPAIHVAGTHDPWHPDPPTYRRLRAEVGDFYLREETLTMLMEDVIDGLANIGFKLIILNTGHYPTHQGKLLKEIAARMAAKLPARIVAWDEDDALPPIDHAGTYETSIFMALGGVTHLDRIREDQKNKLGFWSEKTPPTAATLEYGQACLAKIEAYFDKLMAEILPTPPAAGSRP